MREPHCDTTFQFVGIESVQRLTQLEHNEIRDINHVVN